MSVNRSTRTPFLLAGFALVIMVAAKLFWDIARFTKP
jgi:hypothetical protein